MTVRPITEMSPPKRRFHSPAPSTTTGAASVRPSSGKKYAPGGGVHAEHFEKRCRGAQAVQFFRLSGTGQAGAPDFRRGHGTEAVIACAEIQIVGGRHGEGAAALFAARQDYCEFARVLVGQRAQQHRIDQAEDGRVGTDAERQHQHRREREPRRLAQHTKAVEEVPSHSGLDAGRRRRLACLFSARWKPRRGPLARHRQDSGDRSLCRSP